MESLIAEFLRNDIGCNYGFGGEFSSCSGYGSVVGYKLGDGNGGGNEFGDGYGDGDGCGSGCDNGSGYGDGCSNGCGNGDGCGRGDGFDYDDGCGFARGDSIKSFCGFPVYYIDKVPTLIDYVHKNMAKGRILNSDLSCEPCYIVKQEGYFAHGATLRQAMEAVMEKVFIGMPVEKRISAFIEAHKKNKAYPNTDLFDWHNKLTGSCLAGRNAFVKNHGIDLEGSMTVEEFIELTENDYGGEVISQLKEAMCNGR